MTKRLRALIPDGYEAVLVRRGHLLVRDAETKAPLRLPDGRPLHVAASPSDHRSDRNARSAIRRAIEHARMHGAGFDIEVLPETKT